MENPQSILQFWFGEDTDDVQTAARQSALWWSKNSATDRAIAARFEADMTACARGQHDAWAATPSGLLALILLTDQFPRNVYRGDPQAFSFDALALRWSLDGLARGIDRQLRPIQRVFFYLPLEHAEEIAHQDRSVQLYRQLLDEVPDDAKSTFAGFLDFAKRHREVIALFGRYPHRNAILNRVSSEEEKAFLQTAGSSF